MLEQDLQILFKFQSIRIERPVSGEHPGSAGVPPASLLRCFLWSTAAMLVLLALALAILFAGKQGSSVPAVGVVSLLGGEVPAKFPELRLRGTDPPPSER